MSAWEIVLSVGFFIVVATAIKVIIRRISTIVTLEREESLLTSRLASSDEFAAAMWRYAESIYRDGRPSDDASRQLEQIILLHLKEMRPTASLVERAVNQPSRVGRERYLQKLGEEAIEELVGMPADELDLGSRSSG